MSVHVDTVLVAFEVHTAGASPEQVVAQQLLEGRVQTGQIVEWHLVPAQRETS